MIMASIRMRPGEGKIDSVLRTILRIWEPMRVEPGCLDFHCSRDIKDENVVVLEERWKTREDLDRHVQSDGFRTILSLLEDSDEKPVVEFLEVTATEGLEKIEELRGSTTKGDQS